ncbi:hypothetical protein Tco_1257928 [Tanacetum coccineum]
MNRCLPLPKLEEVFIVLTIFLKRKGTMLQFKIGRVVVRISFEEKTVNADAFESDVDEATTTQTIVMANLYLKISNSTMK